MSTVSLEANKGIALYRIINLPVVGNYGILNADHFHEIFGDHTRYQYVAITADRVIKVFPNENIAINCIGLTSEISREVFQKSRYHMHEGLPAICTQIYAPETRNRIRELTVYVSQETNCEGNGFSPHAVSAHDLATAFKRQIKENYVSTEQTVVLQLYNNTYNCLIETIWFGQRGINDTFGFVDENTTVHFISNKKTETQLYHHVIEEADLTFHFELHAKIHHDTHSRTHDGLILSSQMIEQKLREYLENAAILPNQYCIIPLNENCFLEFVFQRASKENGQVLTNYQGYRFMPGQKLDVRNAAAGIILTNNQTIPAEEIQLKVHQIFFRSIQEKHNLQYLAVSAIQQGLIGVEAPLNSFLYTTNENISLRMRIDSVYSSIEKTLPHEPLWAITPDTTIKLLLSRAVNEVQLIDTPYPKPLKKVVFNAYMTHQTKPIKLKESEIEVALRKTLDEPLSKNTTIEIKLPHAPSLKLDLEFLEYQNSKTLEESAYGLLGKLEADTEVIIQPKTSGFEILSKNDEAILKDPKKALEMTNIGALNDIFKIVLDRVVKPLQRREEAERLGLKLPRGMLLYGPPGTGKTLLALAISKLLNISEDRLKIISAGEVGKPLVGQAEEVIRKLFTEAEQAAKDGDKKLRLIIIDEIDRIAPIRTSGWKGDVTTELMNKMDGANATSNNVFIVGITNFIEQIDPALKRPGRFSPNIEFKNPDEEGREEIFMIHTKEMRSNNLFKSDVKISKLAQMTHKFTGAHIYEVCQRVGSAAMQRDKLYVCMKDFKEAISDVREVIKNKNDSADRMFM